MSARVSVGGRSPDGQSHDIWTNATVLYTNALVLVTVRRVGGAHIIGSARHTTP